MTKDNYTTINKETKLFWYKVFDLFIGRSKGYIISISFITYVFLVNFTDLEFSDFFTLKNFAVIGSSYFVSLFLTFILCIIRPKVSDKLRQINREKENLNKQAKIEEAKYMKDSLLKYNWNVDTGEISNLPDFDNLSQFLIKHNIFVELKLKTTAFNFDYDFEEIIAKGFEKIISDFKTKKNEITFYNFTYNLSEQNRAFFWENSLGKVFYITPLQMVEIFEDVLISIYNNCFDGSLPIKEMSKEDEEYYWDLNIKNKLQAEIFRAEFFTSLQKNSSKEILEICNFKILGALKGAFFSKISVANYNGDENLVNDIVNYINNNKDFQNIVRL